MNQTIDLYANYQTWKSWDKLFSYTSDHAGYFSAELADLKITEADVLEIGFGTGSCVSWMIEKGARVSMTEISDRSCAAARERGYEVLPADLPSAAGDYARRFDTIVALDVFEHLELDDVGRYLDACALMMKPGGRLLLRFPNSQSPFGLTHQAGDPTHKSELNLAVFQLMILHRPFEVVRYGGSHLYRGKPLTPVWVKRSLRRVLQKAIGSLLRFVYASGIPYEPVAVIVLQKVACDDTVT
jgi:2-polyprenyl-3-methyl-5-hydroxy-6-metoxy-1,4-benzoquinol methylase